MVDGTLPLAPDRGARRQQLPEEVATYVRELIISGAVRAGDFLRMEPIADAVGVSNTPVREGLLSLRAEGFVKLVPRRGFMVAPFTAQDIRDLFWAQSRLGGELAARAAANITPELLERFDGLLLQYEAAVASRNEPAVADLGHAFHREVNVAAQSRRLALVLSAVVQHLPNRFYATIEGHVLATQQDHPLILQALRSGDSEGARNFMEQHILRGADRLVDTLTERGVWSIPEPTS